MIQKRMTRPPLLKLRDVLIHHLPLVAHLDPRCAAAGEDGAVVAIFIGIIDDGIPIVQDNGIVGVNAPRTFTAVQ